MIVTLGDPRDDDEQSAKKMITLSLFFFSSRLATPRRSSPSFTKNRQQGEAPSTKRDSTVAPRTVAVATVATVASSGFPPSFIGGRPLMGLLGQGPRPRLPKKNEKPLFLNSILLL